MQINDDPRNNLAERLAQISLILVLLIASVREVLYFFAPEAASLNPIDYVLLVVAMPYIGIVFRRSNQFTKRFSLSLVASFVVFGVIAQLQLGNAFSFENMLKVLFPLLLVTVTAGYTLRLSSSQKRIIAFIVFVFIFAGELRIFGPQGAVTITEVRHSTAYLLIGVSIVIWVSNIRTGAKLNADITINHLSTALCHLGNIAARTRRALVFDPAKEQFIGDADTSKLLQRQYREHWATPVG